MENENENDVKQPGAHNSGSLVGVPGPHVENVGMLDLRSAGAEEVGILKSLRNIGTVLVSSAGRGALAGVVCENVGSILEAEPGEKLLVGPSIDLDGTSLEAMEDGQKYIVVGILTFADDVTPAQVIQKLARLRLTGILLASKAVRGALMARMEHTGPAVTLPSGHGAIVREIGQKTVTKGYLTYLKESCVYINIGQTIFNDDIPVELVESKITAYVNIGQTTARRELLDYLEARCEGNLGSFGLPKQ